MKALPGHSYFIKASVAITFKTTKKTLRKPGLVRKKDIYTVNGLSRLLVKHNSLQLPCCQFSSLIETFLEY